MNPSVKYIEKILNEMAPLPLAEEWDNVGLLAGKTEKDVKVILCALDFSAEVLEQAKNCHADLVITHHPVIFRGITKFTDNDWRNALLMEALRNDIAVYSAHTNLDKAAGGVNDVLAGLLELENVEGLSNREDTLEGIGRVGCLKEPLDLFAFAEKLKRILKVERVNVVSAGRPVRKVAVCGGSGMDFLDSAVEAGADTYVTGDIKYHDAQDAFGRHINLIDATHQATELPMMNELADRLALRFSREGYAVKILVAKESLLFRSL